MKKIVSVAALSVFLLSSAFPLARAEDAVPVAAGENVGTKQDFSDLEKSFKKDRMDNLERRVSDLERENRFLADRVQDVERTVYDYRSRQ